MTGKELVKLTNRVTSSFREGDWQVLAALLNADDAVFGRERLLRSQRFSDDDYESEALTAIKKIVDGNPNNERELLDFLNERYPVGDDSVNDQLISSKSDERTRIVFNPLVFNVPDEQPNQNLISVMMPFSLATANTYKAIKKAALNAGFVCQRADDIWLDSAVIQDVFSLIFRSFIVVCDFSGKNPNVFYEAGIAHTLGKACRTHYAAPRRHTIRPSPSPPRSLHGK